MIENITEKEVWAILNSIPDPEVPAISIVELGVVRKVALTDTNLTIIITPTYSGCPAVERFVADIKKEFNDINITPIVLFEYSPPWTTDWISDEAREKLRAYGIAPPVRGSEDKGVLFSKGPKVVHCPQCKSGHTKLVSQFGSTACKALYSCNDCQEPFDYFKCI